MTLECLGTGSKGNCYLLTNNNEQLIIELGLKYEKIFSKIDLSKVVGIICSHEHSDHIYGNNLEKAKELGVPIITPLDQNYKLLKPYKFGSFIIIPIKAYHNVDCYAYVIRANNKTILFATDTNKMPRINLKIDVLIGEVNHIQTRIENLTMQDQDGEYTHLLSSYKNHHSLEGMNYYLQTTKYKLDLYIIHYSKTKAFDEKVVVNKLTPIVNKLVVVREGEKYEL